MRGNMFSEDPETRDRARKCMIEYCSRIMTSLYPDLDLTHTKSKESNEKCLGDIVPVNNQEIRNLRHESKCIDAKGVIAKCNACNQSFTRTKLLITHSIIGKQNSKVRKCITFSIQYQEKGAMYMQCCSPIVKQLYQRVCREYNLFVTITRRR